MRKVLTIPTQVPEDRQTTLRISPDGESLIITVPVEKIKHYVTRTARLTEKDIPRLLTRQEFRVYDFFMSGLVTKEIAVKLGIEVRTVKSHLSEIYRKFGVHTGKELLLLNLKEDRDADKNPI